MPKSKMTKGDEKIPAREGKSVEKSLFPEIKADFPRQMKKKRADERQKCRNTCTLGLLFAGTMLE